MPSKTPRGYPLVYSKNDFCLAEVTVSIFQRYTSMLEACNQDESFKKNLQKSKRKFKCKIFEINVALNYSNRGDWAPIKIDREMIVAASVLHTG